MPQRRKLRSQEKIATSSHVTSPTARLRAPSSPNSGPELGHGEFVDDHYTELEPTRLLFSVRDARDARRMQFATVSIGLFAGLIALHMALTCGLLLRGVSLAPWLKLAPYYVGASGGMTALLDLLQRLFKRDQSH